MTSGRFAEKNKVLHFTNIYSCYREVGLVPHEYCTPYLAHVQGNKNSKVDIKLCRADILDVKLHVKERSMPEKERNEYWKDIASEAAKEIRKSRKPFEHAIAAKRKRLQLLENYSSAFPQNKIIHLKDLPLRSYNVMAM